MNKIASMLDDIADRLESLGLIREAMDLDVISNTIEAYDIATPYARVTQRERMEDLGFAAQYVSQKPPSVAMQAFIDYYGAEHGPTIYDIAKRSVSGNITPNHQREWQTAVNRAKTKVKQERQMPDDLFVPRNRHITQQRPDDIFVSPQGNTI